MNITNRIDQLAQKLNINRSIIVNAINNNTIYKKINGKYVCVFCGHDETQHNYYSCTNNNCGQCKCGGRRSLLVLTMPIGHMD